MFRFVRDTSVLSRETQSYLDSALDNADLSNCPDLDISELAKVLTGDLEEQGLVAKANDKTVKIVMEYVKKYLY